MKPTETEIDTAYFDDIEGHIMMLEDELDITEDDSIHADALIDRITYLREREEAGDRWVDNDTTSTPDAWRTLATYTDTEAAEQQAEWEA